MCVGGCLMVSGAETSITLSTTRKMLLLGLSRWCGPSCIVKSDKMLANKNVSWIETCCRYELNQSGFGRTEIQTVSFRCEYGKSSTAKFKWWAQYLAYPINRTFTEKCTIHFTLLTIFQYYLILKIGTSNELKMQDFLIFGPWISVQNRPNHGALILELNYTTVEEQEVIAQYRIVIWEFTNLV